MNQETFASGGTVPPVVDISVVALYAPGTGRIVHVHTVTIFEGGRPVSEEEAIENARRNATTLGHDLDRLAVKVSKSSAHGRSPHVIDLATGEFKAVPVPARRPKK